MASGGAVIEKVVTPFDHDLCLSFFGQCYAQGMFSFPQGARVLEIGSAEADWPATMKVLRPDLHITCIDVREAHRPMADEVIKGSVLDPGQFIYNSFDAIVSVSTIEHIGLGFYGDPREKDGDCTAMANCREWIKPDGWMYFDVPYTSTGSYEISNNYRRYDELTLKTRLLPGWTVREHMVINAEHHDSPFVALTVTPA